MRKAVASRAAFAGFLEMGHEFVNKENLRKLFHSTAMHLIFTKTPETVQQNI